MVNVPLYDVAVLALASGRMGQGPATRVITGMLWSERTHAAFLFSCMGAVVFGFNAGSSLRLIGDLPPSSTYAGRRRSCR